MIPAQIPTKKAAILCILGHLLGGERVRHEGHFTSGIIYLHPLGYSALRTFGKCLMDAIGIYLVDKDALMEVKNGYSHVSLVEDRGYPSISVVIPARNEAQNLQYVLPRIPSMVSEVILVDGLSTDETIEVARRVLPDIRIIKQTGKGKGNALRAGFAACTGDIVVTLDADGSADPKEIPYFMAALMLGNDFAKGSRFVKGGGSSDITRFRRLGNFCLNKIVNVLYLAGFSDLCYGYNAFWKYCLDHIDIDCDGFEIETLINLRMLKANFKIIEVASFEYARIHGESNLRAVSDGWRVLKTILKEWVRPVSPRIQQSNVFRTLASEEKVVR